MARPGSKSTTFYWQAPKIESLSDLADHLSLSRNLVRRLVACTPLYYKRTTVPKRRGGYRDIWCPSATLKAVQRWILRNILEKIKPDPAATAYHTGSTPFKNAERHVGNRCMLALDLKDFFPSISAGRVFSVYRAIGYSDHVCHILTAITTLDGVLPQGAVTSPYLSNLICKRLDRRLGMLAGARHAEYTRYADDITFTATTIDSVRRCKALAEEIIADEGFTVNAAKTRLIGLKRQPRITGLALNSEGQVCLTREFKRRVRAAVFQSVMTSNPVEREKLAQRLQGYKNFWNTIEPGTSDRMGELAERFRLRRPKKLAAAGFMAPVDLEPLRRLMEESARKRAKASEVDGESE